MGIHSNFCKAELFNSTIFILQCTQITGKVVKEHSLNSVKGVWKEIWISFYYDRDYTVCYVTLD